MVRSMSFRNGRPQAPSRRQLRQNQDRSSQKKNSVDLQSGFRDGPVRSTALERRRALATVGKAAVAIQGPLGSDRVRIRNGRPQAPSRRQLRQNQDRSTMPFNSDQSSLSRSNRSHPLTNQAVNDRLRSYEQKVKGGFDRIVPVLQQVSALQHKPDFIVQAQRLSRAELGFDLPNYILERAWIKPLDMRGLFAWCVFESHRLFSDHFFQDDPLQGAQDSSSAREFEQFLLNCGIHLLDITPCADGRLAHTVAYVLRIPFSAVRRRSHAGAMFNVENTVNRWIKTEHSRHREGKPNPFTETTRYLKVVTYHFSSLAPHLHGCAAHASNDELAASAAYKRLLNFREAVENSFCCGASVKLLLIGLDTDTDAIRVHPPNRDSEMVLDQWVCAHELYTATVAMSPDQAMAQIAKALKSAAPGPMDPGMLTFLTHLLSNNCSQIDYVRELYGASYLDVGHAERFIGVGIGFKEVHLRNLTYFAHLDTVEEGAPDLDVGIKIFRNLNISRDLPIPIVVRFDYSGRVPGARDRAIADCKRVNKAIVDRYFDLVYDGLLHTCLTIRDRHQSAPAEIIGSTLDPQSQEAH
ncbi:carboxysome shell carbonic anhydrase [Synechococcus sp. M16CYN]|uniref:carboxysome shell carbonic anhydrase n=1 Tax=Synechococcus sp. M16CYN TaxID=3103139 RepID=UPI0030E168C0